VGRPKEQLITENAVVAAAIHILETRGFEKLSLRALGTYMRVNSASLYHHFTGKAQILRAVARHVLRQIDLPPLSEDWEQWIIEASVGYRRLLIARPYVIPIMFGGYRPRTTAVAVSEAKLTEAAVPAEYHAEILFALETCVIGSALVSIMASKIKKSGDADEIQSSAAQFDHEQILRTTIGVILKGMVRETYKRGPKSTKPTAIVLETIYEQRREGKSKKTRSSA
jgi:AcrR family transcriptional regulator